MYIKNIKSFPKEELFTCNEFVGKWLIKSGIPVLSIEGKIYYFHESYELEMTLCKLPFYLKPFLKVPKAFR